MSARTNKICSLVIGLALAVFMAWSIIMEMPIFMPITGFVVALLLMRLCRRFTKEIMADERVQKINDKASAISYRISSILMAIIGLIFITMRNTFPSEFEIVGSTLAYSVCASMLIHLAFYYYYKNKL
ncbi:MAG: DUF2178 domain-containing protein [Dehalococcoidales bacterium]|nr:DUF2178 domain-containing protein [Dehalococcoidales bacterium]